MIIAQIAIGASKINVNAAKHWASDRATAWTLEGGSERKKRRYNKVAKNPAKEMSKNARFEITAVLMLNRKIAYQRVANSTEAFCLIAAKRCAHSWSR